MKTKSCVPEHLINGAVKDSYRHCRHMKMFCLSTKQFNSLCGLFYVILFKLLVMLVHWRLCSPCVHLQTLLALCCPHWGCVTDVPASSSVSGPASWMCFRPVLWVAASCMDCLDVCSSLSGCTQFTAPGTWDCHISTWLCPLYLDPVEPCPVGEWTTNLGVSCRSCISFPVEPFPSPVALGVSWDMPFSEADGEVRSCKRYHLKKEGKLLGLVNLSIPSSLRASEVTVLQENGSLIRPSPPVPLELG